MERRRVNRGVAVWQGKVYVGALDGRLIALDAATGKLVWQVQTTDTAKPYTITGAPRVVKGKVLIGNGGAEFGVRGYVTAYDAETGKQVWRFYTVPGEPATALRAPGARDGREDLARRMVGSSGGGGTVWDSMAYDPGPRSPLYRHRQRLAVEPRVAQPRRRRQPVPVSIVALQAGHRRIRLALPDHARREWDYTATQHDHPRRPRDRRPHAQGADAGAEERLLLRARPRPPAS